MQAVLSLWQEARFDIADIASIEIDTFHESLRLASPHPASPDEAQYSLCWPVAALLTALAEGREFSAYDISEDALGRADIHALSGRIILREKTEFNATFPELRQAELHLNFIDESRRSAVSKHTRGDPETPASRAELTTKFDQLIAATPLAKKASLLKQACLVPSANDEEKIGIIFYLAESLNLEWVLLK